MKLDLIHTVGGYFNVFKFLYLKRLPTVSNLMDNAWEVHSFPVELSDHGNSIRCVDNQRACQMRKVGSNITFYHQHRRQSQTNFGGML